MATLIADCGSSKCSWAIVRKETRTEQFDSPGMNAATLPYEEICSWVQQSLSELPSKNKIRKLYFYGAGCLSEEINAKVREAFESHLGKLDAIVVDSDMYGAFLSFQLKEPAFVGILGTGANLRYFDGKTLRACSPSLGYIMGDEGSGADLGKSLLKGILRERFDTALRTAFYDNFPQSPGQFIRELYESDHPNRYLASFAPFIHRHIDHPQMHALVRKRFDHFIQAHLLPYKAHLGRNLYLVGSVAYAFQSILAERLQAYGYTLKALLARPIEGLIKQPFVNG